MEALPSVFDGRVFLLVALAIAGSALLRGFTGFGFGIGAVPLMSLVMPPAEAVVVAVGLQFFGGLADVRRLHALCDWPSLRWLMAGAVLGSPLGTLALVAVSPATARLLISAICLLAVVALGLGRVFARPPRGAATALFGVVAGLFNGLAAMPGPPVVAYYMASALPATRSRASLVTFFTATAAVALLTTAMAGLWSLKVAALVALGLPLMLAGTFAGESVFRRSGATHHRIASLSVLAAIAVLTGAQGVFGR
jgi:uncharacterized membrane protein YfcA